METIKLSMKKKADVIKLNEVLDTMRRTNQIFTIEFVKQSGEPRIINGISKSYKHNSGGYTQRMTAAAKRENYNIFNCYEIQITAAEVALAEQMYAEPKEKGFKAIQVDNIEKIKFQGKTYLIENNKYVFKPTAVAGYLKTILNNRKKVVALNKRTERT